MTKTNIAGTLSGKKLKASLGPSLLSLSVDIVGLLTGVLLVLYLGVLSIDEAPWALLLFPGILSVRGAVGVFSEGIWELDHIWEPSEQLLPKTRRTFRHFV